MVAKEMLGNCADCAAATNKDMVALVNRDAIADGITAAPVLGRGLGGDGSVPILLVGDELPAEVSDYLSGTAEVRDRHEDPPVDPGDRRHCGGQQHGDGRRCRRGQDICRLDRDYQCQGRPDHQEVRDPYDRNR